MDKIICLVGESGSGKSTIAELLEKSGYNYIQSYTTRPKRYKNETGHIFVSMNAWRLTDLDQCIATTCFDGNYYWVRKEQYQGKGTSIYIIDVAGVKELREKIKDAEIVVIYVKCDERERLYRMLAKRDPKSATERIKHDRQAFKIVECDYVVDINRPIEEILKDIKSLI